MARFIFIHDDEDEEWYVNMEQITAVDPTEKVIYLPEGESIEIGRQGDWQKILKYVKDHEET